MNSTEQLTCKIKTLKPLKNELTVSEKKTSQGVFRNVVIISEISSPCLVLPDERKLALQHSISKVKADVRALTETSLEQSITLNKTTNSSVLQSKIN